MSNKPISREQAERLQRLNKLRQQRADNKVRPFAQEIRRLYLELYLGPIDIEIALNKKVTRWQIKRWLKKEGLWQGRGTVHCHLRLKKAHLKYIDINALIFKEFIRCQRMEERAWERVSWTQHPAYREWYPNKEYYERLHKDVDFRHKIGEEERTGPGYQIIRNLRYGIQKTGVIRVPRQASVVGCSPKGTANGVMSRLLTKFFSGGVIMLCREVVQRHPTIWKFWDRT
jgi:hypothetical protein